MPAGIIGGMTDRGLPTADGSPACPFVAFEDDRDERADRPDHRHRCFAEAVPNLHELFWNANKQASKVKASTSLDDAKKLLDLIDEVDAAWKATGGAEKTRVAGRPG